MVLGILVVLIVAVAVILAVIGITIAYGVSMDNRLVNLNNRVDQAKQNIDVLLKQRQDELSKLIDTTKQFMEQEQEVYEAVTNYNTRIGQIPYVIFAMLFGYSERELFEATEAEKAAVDIGEAFA